MGFYGEKPYSSAVAIARNLVPRLLGWPSGGAVADRELSRRAERSSSCSTCKGLVDRGAGSPRLSERGPRGLVRTPRQVHLWARSHSSSADQNRADAVVRGWRAERASSRVGHAGAACRTERSTTEHGETTNLRNLSRPPSERGLGVDVAGVSNVVQLDATVEATSSSNATACASMRLPDWTTARSSSWLRPSASLPWMPRDVGRPAETITGSNIAIPFHVAPGPRQLFATYWAIGCWPSPVIPQARIPRLRQSNSHAAPIYPGTRVTCHCSDPVAGEPFVR
jgi:hypothetical protein